MEYTLKLQLEGAGEIAETLGKLQAFKNTLSGKSGGGSSGGIGKDLMGDMSSPDEIVKATEKKIWSFKIVDAWGKGVLKTFRDASKMMDWYGAAVRRAALENGKLMEWWDKAASRGGRGTAKEVSEDLKKWREEQAAKGAPNVHISEDNQTNWHDAHVKDWGEAMGMRGSIEPNSVGITDFGAKERLKNEQEDDRIADAIADLKKRRRDKETADAAKSKSDADRFKVDMASAALPFFNPLSPWSTLWGSKNIFKGLSTEHGKQFSEKFMGGIGPGTGTLAVIGIATALGLALKGLSKIVEETEKAFENARQLYAKALNSGLGLNFTAKRSLVANILGVSEADIFRFGNQLAYLNPRLQQASEILARTSIPLTKFSYDWKVLMADISASFAKVANLIAPALDRFINRFDNFVRILNSYHAPTPEETLKIFIPGYALSKGFGLAFTRLDSGSGSGLPGPTSWMKQLPASSWEHMGLQIAGGSTNYARDTARNTARMAKNLDVIAKHFTTTEKPYANLRWGMNPFANNP